MLYIYIYAQMLHIYIYINVYIYIYMLYIYAIVKTMCPPPVITIMALWQLMQLGT